MELESRGNNKYQNRSKKEYIGVGIEFQNVLELQQVVRGWSWNWNCSKRKFEGLAIRIRVTIHIREGQSD